jgi:menaquinone-dependent protoporphyrinogen oxidase
MKVLVTTASKHGATEEIAQAIGDALRARGLEVAVLSAEKVGSVEEWDAVVLGSAVYAGHWLKPAKELVEREAGALAQRPVWLFSSGPVGDPPKPEEDPADVAAIVEATRAREHQIFVGKLEKENLNLPERAILKVVRAAEGDFRDFDQIRAWANGIADALSGS